MRRYTAAILISSASLAAAYAQRGGGGDWTTEGSDAQRSSWVRNDAKINKDSVKSGFQFIWKVKTANQPSAAIMLDRYIGYRGFRSLGFVVGTSDNVTAMDTDLGRIEWQKSVGSGSAAAGTPGCPGGTTAGLTRPTNYNFPGAAPPGRGGGGGRGQAAKGAVGEVGEGSVVIKEIAARAAAAPPMPAGGRGRGRGTPPPGAPAAPGGYNPFARAAAYVYLLSSDGMLHSMYVSNGEEPNPPEKFLPPHAYATGLIVVNNVAYAATIHGCGGAPDQVWALDLASKEVTNWKAGAGGIAGSGGVAFGGDGTLFVTTGDGVLMSLEPKTLKPKDAFNAGSPFTSSPVIFQHKDKVIVAAANKDGQIYLVDAASPTTSVAKAAGDAHALAAWQDHTGTQWLLGTGSHGITAWKVADNNGAPALEPGWTSREIASALTPMIVNGVVFTGAAGSRSTPAVLYAFDGTTGSELWSSGKAISSYVQGGGLAAGNTQLYLGTNDGTVYVFGFPIEH